jgi:RNA polymerase sigma factor (sigma-70 family)
VEASTLQPPASLAKPRIVFGAPLLRLRSDEQLVALFRAGHDEAFRAIHDRYHKRLFAYARQMLPARQDAEDALQDVFVRAYAGLRASDRDLALRAWLFRVAHNRCVDELRKPALPSPEVLQLVRTNTHDPLAEVDLRESLRRLVEDIRRLPEQQRSALLMRELAGMSYTDLASSLGVSVGAVKSLLVRARLGLAQAAAARDTSCALISEQSADASDRGVRPTPNTRKHVRDCSGCRGFRRELRGVSRQLAAIAPTLGPLGFLAKLLGLSGGGAAGTAGGGAALIGGGGTTATAGGLAISTGHVAALLVAAVATAGGAVEIQHTILPAAKPAPHLRQHPGIRHQLPAQLAAPTPMAAVQASAAVPAGAIGTDPPAAFAGTVSSSSTAAKRSATTDADRDPATGQATGTTVAKRRTRPASASTTSTTSATTTGASASGTCSAPGTSPSTSGSSTTTGSSSSASTSGSDSTGDPPPSATSTGASPAAGAPCDSVTGSSTSATSPSSSAASAGTTSTASTATSTGDGSSSSTTTNSDPSAGSPQSGSNVATG